MPLFYPSVPPDIIASDVTASGATSVTFTANHVYLTSFAVNVTTIIVATGWQCGSTAAGKTNMGIYTLSGNLVSGSDTGQVSNSTADVKSTYATPIVLPPGQYFMALSPSSGSDDYLSRLGTATLQSRFRIATNVTSAGALPATTGALVTTVYEPCIALFTQNGLA